MQLDALQLHKVHVVEQIDNVAGFGGVCGICDCGQIDKLMLVDCQFGKAYNTRIED